MAHIITPTAARQHSYDTALAQNGRTFHWARRFLGAKQGADAAQLYAFCRLLDDLADGDLPNGAHRLAQISQDLSSLRSDPNAEMGDAAMAEFAPFLQSRQISPQALQHLIDGLLFDQGIVSLPDEDALITYGYQVAGTVGVMMCPVLSCRDETAGDFAIDLGIAMQFTNIARDVLEDAKMGRRYLPATWADNLTADEIITGANQHDPKIIATIQSAIQLLLTRADAYYESGLSGLSYLPKRAQIAIAVAAYSYRQIGVQLLANGTNWHHGRTVTSLSTKARVSLRALRFVGPQNIPDHHHHRLHDALRGYAK